MTILINTDEEDFIMEMNEIETDLKTEMRMLIKISNENDNYM